eukprot:TRINITY_DN262_c0_g1_i1.p2 TRINITY_DN262_c0_g1~~TRINITY_DN262_c0_g1_i1.p2  ORF type:complete len:104 (+),score=29.32 TRINITY_DN262_c0_g1_i1:140-451(+)
MPNLFAQRRMAMSIFGCGQRKVWMNPSETSIIARAKSRADIRRLIGDGLIVDKSKWSARPAWLRAQVMGTEDQLTTFEQRWRLDPIRKRQVHNLPRVNRARGI